MTFHVGQKVVCIYGDWSVGWRTVGTPNLPAKGAVYTIRALMRWRFGSGDTQLACLLEEIRNPTMDWQDGDIGEHPFWVEHFRPIVEKKTNISIFEKMLTPKKENAEQSA